MLPYFILGMALLAGLLLGMRWFATADPKTLIKVIKWAAVTLIVVVIVFFAATGKLFLAMMALPALVPWFLRMRSLARMAKNFSRMASARSGGGGGTGRSSEVETRFLRMALNHDSGEMMGEVIAGPYSGRRLDGMALGELVDLLKTCWVEDEQSAQVLEAFLERNHPDWRQRAGATGEGGGGAAAAGDGPMTRDEALRVLGLEADAGTDEIKEAYHRLMAGLHPDHGGSTYLAAKINQAKDVLLGG